MSQFGRDGQARYTDQVQQTPRQIAGQDRPTARRGSLSWTVGLVGLLVWSGLSLAGYLAADALLVWLAASGDAVLATGRDVGTLVGAEQAVGTVVENVRASGLWQQVVAVAQALLLPATALIWLLGAIAILILPRIVGFFVGLFRSRRYS